jgi:hypothetical protein
LECRWTVYFILEISFLQDIPTAAPPAHLSLGPRTAGAMVATQAVRCNGPLSSTCPFPHISAQAQRAATSALCESAHEQATEPTRSTLRHGPLLRVRVRGPVLLRNDPSTTSRNRSRWVVCGLFARQISMQPRAQPPCKHTLNVQRLDLDLVSTRHPSWTFFDALHGCSARCFVVTVICHGRTRCDADLAPCFQ